MSAFQSYSSSAEMNFFSSLNRDYMTEEEWEALLANITRIGIVRQRKEMVAFSAVTVEHCTRSDGLGLDLRNAYRDRNTIRFPDRLPGIEASDDLMRTLTDICTYFVLDNDSSKRSLIDNILIESLRNCDNPRLTWFHNVENKWEGAGIRYTGEADYMLGTSRQRHRCKTDSFLVVSQAKSFWGQEHYAQMVCEMGCLLRRRLAVGKETPVFGILTDASHFKFFAVDTNNVVYCTHTIWLSCLEDTETFTAGLRRVLRHLHWIITSLEAISARASSRENGHTPEAALAELRACFG